MHFGHLQCLGQLGAVFLCLVDSYFDCSGFCCGLVGEHVGVGDLHQMLICLGLWIGLRIF